MDYIDRPIGQGYDDSLMDKSADYETSTLDFQEEAKKRRAPYATWAVNGTVYKLRLTGSAIRGLEQAFRQNLLLALTDNGLPPVSDMLTTIQASMQQFHHNMTYSKVLDLFDKYVDEGGDQMKLMSDVIMPLLSVSGFFTASQSEVLADQMKELDIGL